MNFFNNSKQLLHSLTRFPTQRHNWYPFCHCHKCNNKIHFLFSFFLIRKVFSKKKEKHTWLPIVLPVRKIFTDFYPHVQCIHTIYCDCDREIINNMIMAQEIHRTLIIGPRESTILGQKKHEFYSQKMASIQAPFLDDVLAQISKNIAKMWINFAYLINLDLYSNLLS